MVAVVGVFLAGVIALLVLLPESIAALRAARRDQVQTSLNLALGSAMANCPPRAAKTLIARADDASLSAAAANVVRGHQPFTGVHSGQQSCG